MTVAPSLHRLLAATQSWIAQDAPHVAAFLGDALGADLETCAVPPQTLPATAAFASSQMRCSPSTAPLLAVIKDASADVSWQQTYSESVEGIDQNFLSHYGWFNLVAPSGPFVSPHLRLSVGYWGGGLHYPRHAHPPEEIYLVVAGGCRFHTEGRAPLEAGPGTTLCHASMPPHEFETSEGGVLLMAFWRGAALEAPSRIGAQP